jgi:hypothetical protein
MKRQSQALASGQLMRQEVPQVRPEVSEVRATTGGSFATEEIVLHTAPTTFNQRVTSSNVGRAARMNHGDIEQGGTMGRGKGHLYFGTRPLPAKRSSTNGSVAGLSAGIAARAGGDAAESLLPVVVPTRAAPAQAIAAHGVVDIAALDVMTTKASGGGDVRVGASGAESKVAAVDEVTIGEA